MSKVLVITGAGDGLGRALARRFLADGETIVFATVVLLGRAVSKLQVIAADAGEGAMALTAGVTLRPRSLP
jgi:meso-butanediol dehydrogenase/(S,S)-butanediol dehydrogenase/diacetyl reductase